MKRTYSVSIGFDWTDAGAVYLTTDDADDVRVEMTLPTALLFSWFMRRLGRQIEKEGAR